MTWPCIHNYFINKWLLESHICLFPQSVCLSLMYYRLNEASLSALLASSSSSHHCSWIGFCGSERAACPTRLCRTDGSSITLASIMGCIGVEQNQYGQVKSLISWHDHLQQSLCYKKWVFLRNQHQHWLFTPHQEHLTKIYYFLFC